MHAPIVQTPEQQSELAVQATVLPPGMHWHVMPLQDADVHWPDPRHIEPVVIPVGQLPEHVQVFELQDAEVHSMPLTHRRPGAAAWQMPPVHTPEQQSPPETQGFAVMPHEHTLLEQTPDSHWEPDVHSPPAAVPEQVCVIRSHRFEQQSESPWHGPAVKAQAQ